MINLHKNKKLDYFLLAFLTLMATLAFYLLPIKPKKFGDMEYHDGAKAIVGLLGSTGEQTILYVKKGLITILYYVFPYLISEQIGGDFANYLAAISWNALFNFLAVLFLFLTLRNEFGRSAAWLGAILLFLFPIHIYYGMGVLAETPAFFVTSLLLYFWQRTKTGQVGLNHIFTLAILLALLFGIRINTILIFPILGLITLFYYLKKRQSDSFLPQFRNSLSLFLISSIMAGLLYFITNKIDTNKGASKDDLFYYSILQGRYEFREDNFNWIHWTEKDESIDKINQWKKKAELDRICKATPEESCPKIYLSWVLTDVFSHPLLTIKQYSIKFFHAQTFVVTSMFLGESPGWKVWLLHILINSINFLLVFLSIFYLYRHRKKILSHWPLWGIWLAFYGFVCIFHSEPRYFFPLRPFLIFMAVAMLHPYLKRFELYEKLNKSEV